MKLDGAVCIVTGSASGLGSACARRLAAKGARVVVNWSRSEQEARATVAACEAAGAETLMYKADVGIDTECRAMAAAALDRWGRIDCLVNNAGVTKFADPADLELLNAEDFQRVFGVNVIGAYQMIRAVTPAMRAQGVGAIVNVSSNTAMTGRGSSLAYSASKGALNALTIGLARTLGPEIRVNAVCPGIIDTRWMRDGLGDAAFANHRDRHAANSTMGRIAQADDVAEPIVWLLEGAGFITGELIMVDGGVRLGAPPPKPGS